MAQGRKPYSEDAIRRRLMQGNPGMGAPGPSGGKQELSPSNTQGAGSMLKTNIKPRGQQTSSLKRLGRGYR